MNIETIKDMHRKGFIVFSCDIKYVDGAKSFTIPKGYNEFTKENTFIQPEWNSYMMRMGIEYEPHRHIILIDIDNKREGNIMNGLDLWNMWNIKTNTITEITPSKGFHYYFYVTDEQCKYIKGQGTKLECDNIKFAVDYKFTGQPSIIAPSHYNRDGEDKYYSFVGKDFINGTIEPLPGVIFDAIKSKPINKLFTYVKEQSIKNSSGFVKACELSDIVKYMPYIGKIDDYTCWRDVGYILKNLNIESFEIYNEWSQMGRKYNKNNVIQSWNYHKPNNSITIDALIHFVRKDKQQGYENILGDAKTTRIFETLKVDTRYLTNSDVIIKEVDKWYNNDKFLSILSPYDTGKTTLIRDIINKYNSAKVLYVTYRQSLARSFYGSFKKLGFKNYLDGDFLADRQIIQLDSIGKLANTSYDVVIIDEIESVLAHLTAGTIKNKNYGNTIDVFEKLNEILNDSKRVLSLDGDYGNRSHFFLSSFNSPVTVIENIIQFNSKNFIEFNDSICFNDKIMNRLDKNKKIVIVCMSAEDANRYEQLITQKYPDKSTRLYTSKTNDYDKKDVSDINNKWLVDVLIYSPAIESGVDFNIEHFDNLFIVYSQMSTCPRGLNQMMNRVRKFNDNNVCILFEKKINKPQMCHTFEEIQAHYIAITQKEQISVYDMVFCFNMEEKQQSDKNFYGKFVQMIHGKGHKLIQTKEYSEKEKEKIIFISSKLELFNAPLIKMEEYEELLNKQRNNEATKDDKIKIEKYIYASKFGINNNNDIKEVFDGDFLDAYYRKLYRFDNHLNIIDIRNIKNYEHKEGHDYDTRRTIKLCEAAHSIIETMGFKHCYDTNEIEDIKLNEAVKLVVAYNKLNNEKEQHINDTKKAKLGAINTVLAEYCIKVKSIKHKVREGKITKNRYTYVVEPIHDIDQHVTNRVNNGLHIKDKNKLITIACMDD